MVGAVYMEVPVGLLGRSQIHPNSIRKLSGRIVTAKNGSNSMLVLVSKQSEARRASDEFTQKTIDPAIKVIRSYLSMYLSIY